MSVTPLSLIGYTQEEVNGEMQMWKDSMDVHSFQVLERMLWREVEMSHFGSYCFYHSIGSQMLKVAAFITAFSQLFDKHSDLSSSEVILRFPMELPEDLQDVVDSVLMGGSDTLEVGRSSLISVVLSTLNCDKVFKDASFHYDGVDYYGLRDLDPEVRIPGLLCRGDSYNYGPLSGQASRESRVAEIMIGSILKRAGYSSKISETIAKSVSEVYVPENNIVQMSIHKDKVDDLVFISTNGSRHVYSFPAAVKDAIDKNERIGYQARIAYKYNYMVNPEISTSRVYHYDGTTSATMFSWKTHLAKIKQILSNLRIECKWPCVTSVPRRSRRVRSMVQQSPIGRESRMNQRIGSFSEPKSQIPLKRKRELD